LNNGFIRRIFKFFRHDFCFFALGRGMFHPSLRLQKQKSCRNLLESSGGETHNSGYYTPLDGPNLDPFEAAKLNPIFDKWYNLQNREFGKEASQNVHSEQATIAEWQGASESGGFEKQPTPPKTDSSGCFGIYCYIKKLLPA